MKLIKNYNLSRVHQFLGFSGILGYLIMKNGFNYRMSYKFSDKKEL